MYMYPLPISATPTVPAAPHIKEFKPAAQHSSFPLLQAPALLGTKSLRYDRFLDTVESKQVAHAVIRQDQKSVKLDLVDGTKYNVTLPNGYDTMTYLLTHDIPVDVQDTSSTPSIFDVVFTVIQLLILRIVLQNLGVFRFGKPNNVKPAESPKVSFKNVAGVPNAKQDLLEVVDFLKDPSKYRELGAKVPRGVLLVGGPGVGKTLLAKAVAGEANVPFFACSGSEFVEMFVGVGSARLRNLFQTAAKVSPCILFIDEIDSIGKQRSNGGVPGANEEREQTLNQLLTLMDGFDEANNNVIVMAATNRADILDEALTRPGRFDRKVYVESPNVGARGDILRVHTANMPLHPDVSLHEIAMNTVGFTGADLQNLANEAAIQAVRSGSKAVSKDNWDAALEKMILGEPRVTSINAAQRRQIAYHEAGHALVGILVNEFDDLRKISVVPRGRAGGVTFFQPSFDVDSAYATRQYLENKIMVTLGGRIAEDIIFGNLHATTGASADFQEVISLAYDMVANYGFNDAIGPGAWSMLSGPEGAINDEVQKLVNKSYRRARALLRKNKRYLHILANALVDKGTLGIDDIRELLRGISCYINPKTSRNALKDTHNLKQ